MELTRIPISTGLIPPVGKALTEKEAPAALAGSFSAMLSGALKQVNDLQVQANDLAQKLATGQVSDVHTVMIASEKATLALQLTVEIRNKVIEAYQEVMRMPL